MTAPYVKIAPAGLDTADRARWLELRRGGIGGSDAGPVAGLDGYSTRWQVWVDKVTDRGADVFTDDQREALEFGQDMEAVIARRWARRAGLDARQVTRCGMLASRARPWMRVNIDRRVTGCGLNAGPCLLECKNRSAWQIRDWDTGDIEKVPDGPVIQVQHALMVTGWTHGHLAAEVGHKLFHHVVWADAALHKTLGEEESWFWHDHVLTGTPPPVDGTERTGKILARLWDADPDLIVPATLGQLARLEQVRELAATIAADVVAARELEHQIQQEMGDAEILTDPVTGKPVATWKRNGTFSEKRYRADHPKVPRRLTKRAVRIDTQALADADPGTYRQYRARVFRVSAPPKPERTS